MKKNLIIFIFLGIICFGYAQNLSEHHYKYAYKMVRLDSSYDAKIDPKLEKYVAKKRNKMEKTMQIPIAQCAAELESFAPESPLSNFLTDILRNESPKYIKDSAFAKIDVSMLNFGGIRTSMPAGEVTIGDMYKITPFENYLTFILLKGSELRKTFERFDNKFNAPYSGLTILYKDNHPIEILVDNQSINDDKIYKLVTLNFISDGGDHLLEGIKFEKIEYTTITFREFLIEELQKMNQQDIVIKSETDGRAKGL